MPLTSVSFREPGMPETGLLLQDIAYTYRVWVTLIKRLYAPLQYPKKHPPIFTPLRVYAIGCYLRYCGFPRRSLLGSPVNKLAYLRSGTVYLCGRMDRGFREELLSAVR